MRKYIVLVLILILCSASGIGLAHEGSSSVDKQKNENSPHKESVTRETEARLPISEVTAPNHSYMVPYVIVADLVFLLLAGFTIYVERKKLRRLAIR